MEIKYYKAGIASRSLAAKTLASSGNVAVIPFKSTNGSSYNYLSFNKASTSAEWTINNLSTFSIKYVYASTDSTFDIDEYSAKNVVGTISVATATGHAGRTFRISVYNNTENPITVNSFKFEKDNISASTASTGSSTISALVFWVKLDSPVTIAPGITKDFVIDINFQNE